jgi:UDP-2-acetamido-3-amino-2,3-dideoxy-glucuronate N-acetyltransferase
MVEMHHAPDGLWTATDSCHNPGMIEGVYIHSTAVVDEPVEIGVGTKIWHFCHVMPKAKIGDHCVLGQNVFIGEGVKIGNGVKIENNVSIFTGVTLEDDVFCGPSAVFTNVKTPRSAFPRNDAKRRSKTRVKRGATIGANATIVCGAKIGRYAFVGAGAVVTEDVAGFALVVGNPARRVGWRCVCGEEIKFKKAVALCTACRREYRKRGGKVEPSTTPAGTAVCR